MSRITQWSQNPAMADYVMENYAALGPTELSRVLSEQFGEQVQPVTIRLYHTRREERERRLTETFADVAYPQIEPSPGGELRPDQRQPMGWKEIEELYTAATREVERQEATQLGQTRLTVNRSKESLPIGVCFWSDWQVGASGVMMRQLRADAEAIAATAGLYTFSMGDLVQNFNAAKHPSGLHDCPISDNRNQQMCARWILNTVAAAGKLEGMVTGNHEQNSKKAAGLTPTEDWAREFKVPYLWHGALVNYTVGAQLYTLGLRHKFRSESGINTTSAQRAMYEQWQPADVEVLGHRHFNDMQKRPKPGRDVVWLRAGSYLRWDDYAQDTGGYTGCWGIPLIVLYPDVKKIIPFYGSDFYTGLEFLADQRKRYTERQIRVSGTG